MTKAVTHNTFCNNYDEVSTLCHKYDEPVYITKDGKNDLVALSLEHYRKLTVHFDLLEELQKEEIRTALLRYKKLVNSSKR